MNIVDIAAGSDDFNLLVRALTDASLVETVRDAENITVFAPTDAAFVQLAQNLGYDGDPTDEDAAYAAIVAALTGLAEDDNPIPLLTNVLLYHVSDGLLNSGAVTTAVSIDTLLTGASIRPDGTTLGDAEPDLPDPVIIDVDIEADNGILHVIDNVLLPLDVPGNSTITGLVAKSGDEFDDNNTDFDMLLAAVQAAGLAGVLDDPEADLTVFAPTDAAFIATAQALGYDGDDEAGAFGFIVQAATLLSAGTDPIPLISTILQYHVSPGAKDSTAVLAAESIPTLIEGAALTLDGTSIVDAEPDLPNPNLVTLDLAATNGIVHAIDGVLLPVDLLQSDGSNAVDFIIASGDPVSLNLGLDDDFILATDGDDAIAGGPGNDVIVGGDGIDTAVFGNDFKNYTITINTSGVTTVTDKTGAGEDSTGTDSVNGVELLNFGDNFSFLDAESIDLSVLEGGAGLSSDQFETLTELYVAYFNRAPDAFGILFWANALANGVSMREIAEQFSVQPEAAEKLPPSSEVGAFVDLAYSHVLERAPDDEGRAFWVGVLEREEISRGEFVLELLAGARAEGGSADDVRTIEDKADIGVSYALINGLTDVDNASAVMEAYMVGDRDGSLAQAQMLIEGFAADAAGGADGPEGIVQIVGAVDDPFAIA